nr:MAG TPA: hypothetical protein [Caudoviricetes sp.]
MSAVAYIRGVSPSLDGQGFGGAESTNGNVRVGAPGSCPKTRKPPPSHPYPHSATGSMSRTETI